MRAHVHGHGAERGQLREQLLAVLHVGVVRLVVAEPRPHGRHTPDPLVRVDTDRDILRAQRGRGGESCERNGDDREAHPDSFVTCASARAARVCPTLRAPGSGCRAER